MQLVARRIQLAYKIRAVANHRSHCTIPHFCSSRSHLTTLNMFNFLLTSSMLALVGIAVAQEYSFYGQGSSIVPHVTLRPAHAFYSQALRL